MSGSKRGPSAAANGDDHDSIVKSARPNSPRECPYKLRDLVNAVDQERRWLPASVLRISQARKHIQVKFDDYSDSSWHMWFDWHSCRVAPRGSQAPYPIEAHVVKPHLGTVAPPSRSINVHDGPSEPLLRLYHSMETAHSSLEVRASSFVPQAIGNPCQLGVFTTSTIKKNALIDFYAAHLVNKEQVKKESRPLSHNRQFRGTSDAWDGLPTADLFVRYTPQSKSGVETLRTLPASAFLPLPGTAARRRLDLPLPLGCMINSPGSGTANVKIGDLSSKEGNGLPQGWIPVVRASRDIRKGEELSCRYHNTEESMGEFEPSPVAMNDCDSTKSSRLDSEPSSDDEGNGPRLRHPREPRALSVESHNLPSLHGPTRVAPVDSVQCYRHPYAWQSGLQWNCERRGVKVKTSGLENAGDGLFACKDIKAKELIGWFWGKFCSKAASDAMVQGGSNPTTPFFPGCSPEDEEPYAADARRGLWHCVQPAHVPGYDSDGGEAAGVLLVSRQCPMEYINDPRDSSRINVETVDGGPADYTMTEVRALRDIDAGDELFIDYQWSADEWKHAAKLCVEHRAAKQRIRDQLEANAARRRGPSSPSLGPTEK